MGCVAAPLSTCEEGWDFDDFGDVPATSSKPSNAEDCAPHDVWDGVLSSNVDQCCLCLTEAYCNEDSAVAERLAELEQELEMQRQLRLEAEAKQQELKDPVWLCPLHRCFWFYLDV